MNIQEENQHTTFLWATEEAQRQHTPEVIQRKWNSTHLGKPAELVTIQRWLRPGPDTKNSRFEPWLIGLVSQSL